MKAALGAIGFLAFLSATAIAGEADSHSHTAAVAAAPSSLAVEHEHIHHELEMLTRRQAPVGPLAESLAAVLEPHFRKENVEALPLIGLLVPLSAGEMTEAMRPAIAMSRALRASLPGMLAEHKAIRAAVEELRRGGEESNDSDAVAFAEKLALHAATEEQVLYPAAILAGEFIAARLPRK